MKIKEMIKVRRNKGITLIALVITILVPTGEAITTIPVLTFQPLTAMALAHHIFVFNIFKSKRTMFY